MAGTAVAWALAAAASVASAAVVPQAAAEVKKACVPVREAPVFNNGTYYRDAYAASTPTELRKALEVAISTDYQRYSYSCVWDIAGDADEDPNNTNNVILFYTGQSWPKTLRDNGSNDEGWNREHVWPKSHGFPNEGDEPYTDGHHLSACDKWVNNRRSNKDFDAGGTPLCLLPLDNPISNCEVVGASTSTTFDVPPAYRGNAARMLFYLEVRYAADFGLSLVDRTTASSTFELGVLCTLYNWHFEDPVDELEIRRNERVYGWQYNRNPFVDHPEWVETLWSGSCRK